MSAVAESAILARRDSPSGRLSDFFWRNPKILLLLMLTPPLLWLGVVYLGSLFALLLQSFFAIDDFSGLVNYEFTLSTYKQLLIPSNFDIILRTVVMAALVTLASAVIAFPIAYYAARYAKGKWKAIFYLGVMLPLWSSSLVKIYAWKLILAKEGILGWGLEKLHLTWLLEAWLALPGIVAGSIFTFSLTLGDYIIPQIIGTSRLFIGQAVYAHQGTAGNIPLAAAFTVVPIVVMGFYLWGAKRMGAFDAL